MTRILIYLFLLLACSAASAQEPSSKSKKAIDAYNNGLRSYSLNKYFEAEQYFLTAIKEDNAFIEAYLVLAEVYEDWNKPLNAIEAYRRGLPVKETFYPYGYIRLGNLQYREGLYDKALESYRRFLELDNSNMNHVTRAQDGIARCEFALNALQNPVEFKPVNLGPKVNSDQDEYWPSLSADERTLFVTRLIRSDEFMKTLQEDFYISRWEDTAWSEMKSAGSPLNTPDNEGAQTITADGRYMVFTACNRRDGIGRCDLYETVREGDTWSIPVNMGAPVNTKYRETQPSISADGRTLYFASDRPGGKGYHDIWVAYRQENGQWTNPVNLGDSINSPGQEMSPFIHPDNQSLYFSSDGFIGMGGYDLFISQRDSAGQWTKPRNLGYPINTNRDEIGLIVNARGDKAYYASDFDKTKGKDIYVFDLPPEKRPVTVTYMKGNVFDDLTRKPLRARFELVDLETGNITFNAYSDSLTGEFLISIPVNRNYLLNVSRRSYLFYSDNFSLKDVFVADRPYLKDIPLQRITAGSKIVLKNVFFETDSYALRSESRIELNKVSGLLKANPSIKIEIGGHTDNTGSPDYNQELSEKRAKAVADYLVSSGIEPARITWKGYSFNMPVAGNDTAESRALNRRTEMKVIE